MGDGSEVTNREKNYLELELLDKVYAHYDDKVLSHTLKKISDAGRIHMQWVKTSRGDRCIIDRLVESEYQRLDALYADVDRCMLDYDFPSIEETELNLREMLCLRQEKIEELKMEALRQQHESQQNSAT